MSIELGTFYTILVKRGLLTPEEVRAQRRAIQHDHDANFQRMVAQLGRQMQQAPNTAPPDPTDPRRNPAT